MRSRRAAGRQGGFARALTWALVLTAVPVTSSLAAPFLLKDVAPGPLSSFPIELTRSGTRVFFAAGDETRNCTLWVTDGTAAGTVRVKDVGPRDDCPRSLTALDDGLAFTADDGVTGRELWKTDGTEAGTVLVKDINPGPEGSFPFGLVSVGGLLLFTTGFDEAIGIELWKSDGTAAGTMLVKDIRPGPDSALALGSLSARPILEVAGTIFLAANDGTTGTELWKTDGTEAGTVRVKDISPGGRSSRPRDFVALDGRLFFNADDGTHGQELWTSDGTEAGTVLVTDIDPGPGSGGAEDMRNLGGTLFFRADDGTTGPELWQSDGTAAGTVLVSDAIPGPDGSGPFDFVAIPGAVVFLAGTEATGVELWGTDGTAAGTALIQDIFPGPGWSFAPDFSDPHDFTVANGSLFFTADDGRNGEELWKSDGTAPGTALAADLLPGPGDGSPHDPVLLDGTLLLAADDGASGVELWAVPVCGDGDVDPAESCDDGNTAGGDCCSAACEPTAIGTRCTGGAGDDPAGCLVDVCSPAGRCDPAPVDFAAVRAEFAPGLDVAACASEQVPQRIPRLFDKAGARVERAATAEQRKKERRNLRRAGKQLRRGEKVVSRARRLGAECRMPLAERFADARALTQCLLEPTGGGS